LAICHKRFAICRICVIPTTVHLYPETRCTLKANTPSKLDQIREQLPAVQRTAFLNTGSCGPLPAIVAEAMAQVARHELEVGRADLTAYIAFREKITQTRVALGQLFNVDFSTIALTHHTTEGMNIITWGLEWQPGDEIVTTTIEHPGGLYPLYAVRARRGVVLRFADVGLGADPLPAIERAFSPRTRLLVLSHVSYSTGARFPLREIIQFAHSRGVMVAVDGAQSAGASELDLSALEVDFYAIPGQKWLCGPEGSGALYVRPDRLSDLHPTFVGYSSFERHDWQGHYLPTPGAARYHTASFYRPGVIGQLTALRWFQETVEPAWAYQRIAHLAGRCRELLEGLDDVRVITPPRRQAGLINFVPLGWSPKQMAGLTLTLIERGYLIRSISHPPYCLRVSTGFYNTDQELAGLRDALAELLDAGPDAVEIPERARELSAKPIM
jgi:L-cysteine/cystine lyase